MRSATDDKCVVVPTTNLADKSLTQPYSVDYNTVTWLRDVVMTALAKETITADILLNRSESMAHHDFQLICKTDQL